MLESTWDAAGQLVRQVGGRGRSSGPGAGKVLERVYGWDRAYAPVSVADLRWGRGGYRYDRNGQVVEGRHGDGSAERYGYDAALNVAEFAEADGPAAPGGLVRTASYGRDPAGRLQAWRGTAGVRVEVAYGPSGERVTYRHDVCGRVVERVLERDGFRSRVWRYAWDGKDRLVGCTTPTGERWAYGYDPFGRRLWKRRTDPAGEGSGLVGTVYGWDGDLLSAEAPLGPDGSADWARATIWHYEPGTFRPLAREGADGSLAYVVTDHLGTPRELVDAEGRLLWSAEYRVWGSVRRVWVAANDDRPGGNPGGGRLGGGRSYAVAGNLALAEDAGAVEAVLLCPLRFQGQWQDGETGLVYNRFRYYDPITTQYVSPDPIGLVGGLRSQGYTTQPTINIDPFGLDPNIFPNGSGGVTFGPNVLYNAPGVQNTVVIQLTGGRSTDFTAANRAAGITGGTPEGYTWHHMQDFNAKTGTSTMQLVKRNVHQSVRHSGSVSQFEKMTATEYGTAGARSAAKRIQTACCVSIGVPTIQ